MITAPPSAGKLQRALDLLAKAGTDPDLLGPAHMKLHEALGEHLRNWLASLPQVPPSVRERLRSKNDVQWLELCDLMQQYGNMDTSTRSYVLGRNALRNKIAHNDPFTITRQEVQSYAAFVQQQIDVRRLSEAPPSYDQGNEFPRSRQASLPPRRSRSEPLTGSGVLGIALLVLLALYVAVALIGFLFKSALQLSPTPVLASFLIAVVVTWFFLKAELREGPEMTLGGLPLDRKYLHLGGAVLAMGGFLFVVTYRNAFFCTLFFFLFAACLAVFLNLPFCRRMQAHGLPTRPLAQCSTPSKLLAVALVPVVPAILLAVGVLPMFGVLYFIGVTLLSLWTFHTYAFDKCYALETMGRQAVRDRKLHLQSAFGGWPGAWLAQKSLPHLDSEPSFLWYFWGSVSLNVAAILACILAMGQIAGLLREWLPAEMPAARSRAFVPHHGPSPVAKTAQARTPAPTR